MSQIALVAVVVQGAVSPLARFGRRCDHHATPISMQERTDDITLNVAMMAAVFCSLVAAVYAAVQVEPSPAVALFLTSAPLYAVILWPQKDARRTRVAAVHDWGYFLLLAWPVVIPWYAFTTGGTAGWKLTAGLFGLVGASCVSWFIVAYAMWYFSGGAR